MYKNQLQELAQRSCFNLPSYSCIREGPDHAPRFKAIVNFNGEVFESPSFCSTLRLAEHAAAEVALNTLAIRGPSRALAARVLDETGVYKNLLQETAHRAGLNLPVYTTVRSGPGHVPVFSCTVELAGMSFTGEPARTKKQAQKNAALAAWSSLKRLAQHGSPSSPSAESKVCEEQEQVTIARALGSLRPSETRVSAQNDNQHGHQRNIPIRSKSTLPSSSLCAMQFQNWAYPTYSPEIAMYHLWQQEQLLHHQHRLFQLPISPSTPSTPPLFPYVQSVIHPDHFLYFPGIEQESTTSLGPRLTLATSGPPFCFSEHLGTDTLRARSTVTIQEIQEEKPEETPVTESFVPGKSSTEPSPRVTEPAPEDDQRTGNIKLEGTQTQARDREWAYRTIAESSFEPVDFPRPNLRHQYPPRVGPQRSLRPLSGAHPVMIRTVGPTSSLGFRPQNPSNHQFFAPPRMRTGSPSCSARPMPGRAELVGGVRHSFMAPAVRIRSVVPVCSAPPPREMPGPSRAEGPSPKEENKDKDQHKVSQASSELDKLKI